MLNCKIDSCTLRIFGIYIFLQMSPSAKKTRSEKPASNYSGPLQLALKGLSIDQLVDILQELVTNHPNLEEVDIYFF